MYDGHRHTDFRYETKQSITLSTKTHRSGTWEFKNRTSTVGLPRLLKIWRALMAWIVIAIGEERFLVSRVCERGREKSMWSSRFF